MAVQYRSLDEQALTGLLALGSKKRFNVDSPSFTPSLLSGNGVAGPKKSTAISPKAASAAPFQPRGASSSM
jgi:PAB-dependent poly(A)-specific ribonuclease subunit 3